MTANAFEPLSRLIEIPLIIDKENVDTDQIFPARFLTTTSRKGLGDLAFYDWRQAAKSKSAQEDWLNHLPIKDRTILVAAKNFGCGSSREHAPWALYDYGVRVVLGEGVADIFKNNCRKNGIAAIDISSDIYKLICENREAKICVNVRAKTINVGALAQTTFEMDDLALECLISGTDQLGVILKAHADIERFEATRTRG